MSLDSELAMLQKNVPECVAAGVVDMRTGMLLGVRTVDSHPQEVLDLVAAATGDLFQGQNVIAIERMFKQTRGVKDDGHHYFQEFIVMSDNLIHVFQRGKRNEDMVMVTVARASANLGMVITRARTGLAAVEAAV
jgi:predicted regulator of Ras-like GTPase activity (Roadblock/LC7/MglB family)